MFKFSRLFRGSYFRVLVVGRENFDLAKISRYTIFERASQIVACPITGALALVWMLIGDN